MIIGHLSSIAHTLFLAITVTENENANSHSFPAGASMCLVVKMSQVGIPDVTAAYHLILQVK